jgi:hypothetical protein
MMRSWMSRLMLLGGLVCGASAGAQEATEPAGPANDAAADGEMRRELRTVEQSVHDLKERVFRTKATLQLLRELVVDGVSLGSGIAVWHVNALPKAYDVESIQYFLDGKSIYAWTKGGAETAVPRELQIRGEAVAPGQHTLLVTLVLRGNGQKVFTYVDDYLIKKQSSQTFDIEEGKLVTIRVRAVARGGVKKSFVDRPTVEYEARSEQYQPE